MEANSHWTGRLFKQHGMQELMAEIRAGDCDLVADAENRVLRVVTIVALRLRSVDGLVLTQVGKVVKGVCISSCQPPGTKVKVGEYPKMAVDRLIQQKLTALSSRISVTSHSIDEEDRVSRKYGVNSRYMRTLFEGSLSASEEDYMMVVPRGGRLSSGWSDPTVSRASTISRIIDPTPLYDAFIFRSEWEKKPSTLFVYAWLSQGDFALLSSKKGAAFLQRWLSELTVNELVEGDIQRI